MLYVTKSPPKSLNLRAAPPSAPQRRPGAPVAPKLDAAAVLVQMQRRQRRAELIDIILTAPKSAASTKPKSAQLPPSPMQRAHPRFLGPHEWKADAVRFEKYLRCASAIASVRCLNADERHHVECAQARLAELKQLAGAYVR